MRSRLAHRAVVGALFLVGMFAGQACAVPAGRIYVRIGPPVPIVEARVVAPGPGHIWVPGYHRWSGSAYIWVPGAWMMPPRPRALWVPPRWVRDRRGWYFVPGHWR